MRILPILLFFALLTAACNTSTQTASVPQKAKLCPEVIDAHFVGKLSAQQWAGLAQFIAQSDPDKFVLQCE